MKKQIFVHLTIMQFHIYVYIFSNFDMTFNMIKIQLSHQR